MNVSDAVKVPWNWRLQVAEVVIERFSYCRKVMLADCYIKTLDI